VVAQKELLLVLGFYYFTLMLFLLFRRGAGVVERGGLENRWGLTALQGSNPCLSARKST
jgi:hypothetical protein